MLTEAKVILILFEINFRISNARINWHILERIHHIYKTQSMSDMHKKDSTGTQNKHRILLTYFIQLKARLDFTSHCIAFVGIVVHLHEK